MVFLSGSHARGIRPARALPQDLREVQLPDHQMGSVHFQERPVPSQDLTATQQGPQACGLNGLVLWVRVRKSKKAGVSVVRPKW